MAEFKYAPMFQLGEDTTQYYKIPGSEKLVKTTQLPDGKTLLEVSPEALTLVAQQSFHDCQFMLRRAHNEQVAAILNDPEASENDKYVALQFLRNAETSVKGVLPFCQDTGTAIIHGEKGQGVWTDFELLAVLTTPHPFPLSIYFGTLVGDLDSFPFAYGRYHPYTDC